ncbi:SDR family oxidoreductase [Legionella worsleiensis]|uniref:NAD-dependent epimerase/dehydratase n=1 Tax=Legionella worsleiensis TaxID=45076 RepID=A0A0W1AKT2_9GAMM|nr:SDR family oxidoreductase [Legionella worsleiensis]KTD81965.1 NAD-dependent epimerase/dehydratase [Legionella worsleiensis]STY31341.1 oxidoreductase (NAD-dependent epimerase/dehydratase) [Legionella worsleiensis]
MHHLIIGYGYCGYYLAQELLKNKQTVTALSRHLQEDWILPGLNHLKIDLNQPFHWNEPNTVLYYLIPPSTEGDQDNFLKQFLAHSQLNLKKVIYFGSSGVYGNHQGAWVDEESLCHITYSRQKRRLDAEQQWLSYCSQRAVDAVIMRIAGIYGPNRLPVEAAKSKIPVIELDQAPYTNHIFVKDLARIAAWFGQNNSPYTIYNTADGAPGPMGTLQQLVAQSLGIEQAPYESWQESWDKASPMKREFMNSSKRLDITRLVTTLGASCKLTTLKHGVEESLAKTI